MVTKPSVCLRSTEAESNDPGEERGVKEEAIPPNKDVGNDVCLCTRAGACVNDHVVVAEWLKLTVMPSTD
jgi:hypothetical protein